MCAIIGDMATGIIAFIITSVKSTLFWGGDALICGLGNWCANAVTGIMGIGGIGVGAGGLGLGGVASMIGGWAWIPALTGALSGVGGTFIHTIWNFITTIEPIIGSAVAACIGLIPLI